MSDFGHWSADGFTHDKKFVVVEHSKYGIQIRLPRDQDWGKMMDDLNHIRTPASKPDYREAAYEAAREPEGT